MNSKVKDKTKQSTIPGSMQGLVYSLVLEVTVDGTRFSRRRARGGGGRAVGGRADGAGVAWHNLSTRSASPLSRVCG